MRCNVLSGVDVKYSDVYLVERPNVLDPGIGLKIFQYHFPYHEPLLWLYRFIHAGRNLTLTQALESADEFKTQCVNWFGVDVIWIMIVEATYSPISWTQPHAWRFLLRTNRGTLIRGRMLM